MRKIRKNVRIQRSLLQQTDRQKQPNRQLKKQGYYLTFRNIEKHRPAGFENTTQTQYI